MVEKMEVRGGERQVAGGKIRHQLADILKRRKGERNEMAKKLTANSDYKKIQEHLNVLEARTKQLKADIKRRKKKGDYYNASDPKRILAKIKSAKKSIANAGYI